MAETFVGVNDAKAIKKWRASLAKQTGAKGYFTKKFEGDGDNYVIQRMREVESDAGDRISFDLAMQFIGQPTYGDEVREGLEENLRMYTDEILIDQVRHSSNPGGRMSRKRTLHDLRAICRDRESDYWSRFIDQVKFIYLSGARGINLFPAIPLGWTGHAGNAIQAPDAAHQMWPTDAITAKTGVAAGDKMTRTIIERAGTRATMMQEEDNTLVSLQPVSIDGEPHFVTLMSEYQAYDMRTSTATGDWFDIQKAATTAEGRNNPIFKGALGMLNNIVLHKHEYAIRFNDYGAGANVEAARALFLGRQAGAIAYGAPGGLSFQWTEELKDGGNRMVIYCGTIFGFKKTRFNGRDFGVMAIDTAAKKVL